MTLEEVQGNYWIVVNRRHDQTLESVIIHNNLITSEEGKSDIKSVLEVEIEQEFRFSILYKVQKKELLLR